MSGVAGIIDSSNKLSHFHESFHVVYFNNSSRLTNNKFFLLTRNKFENIEVIGSLLFHIPRLLQINNFINSVILKYLQNT